MDSYRENVLIDSSQGTIDELKQRIEELEGKATHHVIGKLPKKGDIVKVNGLLFKVISADGLEGKLRLKKVRPKQ